MNDFFPSDADSPLKNKLILLREILRSADNPMVAYSGGVDSTFLMAASVLALGPNKVRAVIADSPLHPKEEIGDALNRARSLGFSVEKIPINELLDENIRNNGPRRCFYCKKLRFEKIIEKARALGYSRILEGSNADDKKDYRPGTKALEMLGIESPLKDAGLTKAEIRQVSKEMGLETHNLPSSPCLATRFPYGVALDPVSLEKVRAAELLIKSEIGIETVRVRVYGPLVRIEALPEDFEAVMVKDRKTRLIAGLKGLGYLYVTLDLEGFRSGSMNETLRTEE